MNKIQPTFVSKYDHNTTETGTYFKIKLPIFRNMTQQHYYAFTVSITFKKGFKMQ